MSREVKALAPRYLGLLLVILCCATFPNMLVAGSKEHPLQGTVTGLGINEETTGGGTNMPVFTHEHRTYTIATDTRVFVLQCPYQMDGLHFASPSECGGKKKIAIGDTVRFRIEKNNAFVLTGEGKDEKLKVVSESMNATGNAAPTATRTPQ